MSETDIVERLRDREDRKEFDDWGIMNEAADEIKRLRTAPATATNDVLAEAISERLRQIDAEGWTTKHDDSHSQGEMARAAAAYCLGQYELMGAVHDGKRSLPWRVMIWPWSNEWWKPKSRREDLIRAAALILAEIERLDRLETPNAE